MVDFSRLIRQAEEARGRPPRPKRVAAKRPRRKAPPPPKAVEPAPSPVARPVVSEPPIAEDLPSSSRPPVPPPEAILEALIPTDPVATSSRVEPPVEEPPPTRPPAPPPLEAVAEEQIPTDPPQPRGAIESAEEPPAPRSTRAAPPEAEAEAAIPSDPALMRPPIVEAPVPKTVPEPSEEVVPTPTQAEPAAPDEHPPTPIQELARLAQDEPDTEPVAASPAPVEVDWAEEPASPQPVDDGLSPVQRVLVTEVKEILASLEPLRGPAARVVEEEPAPPIEEAPSAARAAEGETPLEPEPASALSPEQEDLIAQVKAILAELGPMPRKEEEEPAPASDARIEDVPASLPGTEAVELPPEPTAESLAGSSDLGEILGVVRDEAAQAVAEIDERAALAEALSPSPPAPDIPGEAAAPVTEPVPEAPSPPAPETAATELAPAAEAPPPPPEAPPPPSEAPPPPKEELLSFPPPVLEPPPPEPPRPRRREPIDLLGGLRRRGKDLFDVGILLAGLAWLAGGLYSADPVSWLVAVALIAIPTIDLYRRSAVKRSTSL